MVKSRISCAKCPKGIELYSGNGLKKYTYERNIYGLYKLQPSKVNGSPYFKKDIFGIWTYGNHCVWIGKDAEKGEDCGFAYVEKSVYCPHQIKEFDMAVNGKQQFVDVGKSLSLKCGK